MADSWGSWKSELGELEIQSSGSRPGSWSGGGYSEDFGHLLQGLSERPKRKDLLLNPGSKGGSKMIAIGGLWRSVTQRGAERRRVSPWMSDFWRSP